MLIAAVPTVALDGQCLSFPHFFRADFTLQMARLTLTGQRSESPGVRDVFVFRGWKEFVFFSTLTRFFTPSNDIC